MQVSICMSQVQPMLDWLEALANARADKQDFGPDAGQ